MGILSEGNELKKTAVDYCHPERTIPSTDPSWFARNFFHTPKLSSDDAKMVDVEGTEDDRHESFDFYDGYDQYTDLRKQLSLSINRRNQSIVLRLLLTSHIKLLRSRKRKDTCLVLLHVLPFLISFEVLYLLIRGYFVFISCVFIVWMKIMVKLFLNHFFY